MLTLIITAKHSQPYVRKPGYSSQSASTSVPKSTKKGTKPVKMTPQPVEQTTAPPKKSGAAQPVNTTPAGAGPTIQDVLSQLTTEQQEQLAAMPQDQDLSPHRRW